MSRRFYGFELFLVSVSSFVGLVNLGSKSNNENSNLTLNGPKRLRIRFVFGIRELLRRLLVNLGSKSNTVPILFITEII